MMWVGAGLFFGDGLWGRGSESPTVYRPEALSLVVVSQRPAVTYHPPIVWSEVTPPKYRPVPPTPCLSHPRTLEINSILNSYHSSVPQSWMIIVIITNQAVHHHMYLTALPLSHAISLP